MKKETYRFVLEITATTFGGQTIDLYKHCRVVYENIFVQTIVSDEIYTYTQNINGEEKQKGKFLPYVSFADMISIFSNSVSPRMKHVLAINRISSRSIKSVGVCICGESPDKEQFMEEQEFDDDIAEMYLPSFVKRKKRKLN